MQKNFINKLSAFCVLYVEDEDGIRNNIEEILKHLFKEVSSAKNASEAYIKYIQNKPDLIITDIKMGNETGIDLLKRVRETDSKTRVISVPEEFKQEPSEEGQRYGNIPSEKSELLTVRVK